MTIDSKFVVYYKISVQWFKNVEKVRFIWIDIRVEYDTEMKRK